MHWHTLITDTEQIAGLLVALGSLSHSMTTRRRFNGHMAAQRQLRQRWGKPPTP